MTAGPSATLPRLAGTGLAPVGMTRGEVVLPSEIGRRWSELQITRLLNNRPIPWQRPFPFNSPSFVIRGLPQACLGAKPRDLQFVPPATNLRWKHYLPLSSRPERTRISCLAPLDKAACAPFFKERRMLFASATNVHRKSGGA